MRATRAYIVGFGTAGSILAGCAVLFVVASAVLAFRGWPKIVTQGAPVALRLDSPATGPGSRVARRLAPLLAAATAAPAGRGDAVSWAPRTAGSPPQPFCDVPRRPAARHSSIGSTVRLPPVSPLLTVSFGSISSTYVSS